MNTIQKIEHWGDEHHAKWLDFVRMALGIFILLKGISFISDTSILQKMIMQNNTFGFSGLMIVALEHVVAFIHITGGILITLGVVTRAAVVMQIPIVLGAILFVNFAAGFSSMNSELWLSILTLILLVLFWIEGSGPLSVDYMMKHKLIP